MRLLTAAAAVAATLAFLALPPAGANHAGGSADVVSVGFQYVDQTAVVKVPAGATVRYQNLDFLPHTITATGGAFSSGAVGFLGNFGFAAPAPGNYPYFCEFHPFMTGTLRVG